MPATAAMSTASDALYLAGSLVLLVRALEQQVRATSAADGLGITELGVLGRIERGVDQPSQLARALDLDPARVTHLTDRLVALGYIERTVDPDDRRRWRLHLTSGGSGRLRDGRAQVRAAMETLMGGLSAGERADLSHGLEGMRRVLEAAPAAE